MAAIAPTPVRYSSSLEQPELDEATTAQAICLALRGIIETTSKHSGHGYRSVHAKSHALLEATLTVPGDLPAALAQGLFATPGHYRTFMRFSTIAGDILDDKVSLPRGLGLKIAGVIGERLPGPEAGAVQDFLLTNGPAFSTDKASKFLRSLKLVARTTDRLPWAKTALSTLARGAQTALEAVGAPSSALMVLGGYKPTNPAGDTYFSQTPFRFGDYVAKFSVVPVSPALLELTDVKLDLSGGPDRLREEMNSFFGKSGGAWELQAQLLTDLAKMPVEDASVTWPEDDSPYVTVARIEVTPQQAWNPARAAIMDDGMAFNPWNCLAAHQPLGSINRVRRSAYALSSSLRSHINSCPFHPITAETTLPV